MFYEERVKGDELVAFFSDLHIFYESRRVDDYTLGYTTHAIFPKTGAGRNPAKKKDSTKDVLALV